MNANYGGYGGYGKFGAAEPKPPPIRTVVHSPLTVPSWVTAAPPSTASEEEVAEETSPLGPDTEPFPTPAGGIDTEAMYYAFPEEKKKGRRGPPPPQPAAQPNPYLIGGLLLTALVGVGVFALTRRGRRRRVF